MKLKSLISSTLFIFTLVSFSQNLITPNQYIDENLVKIDSTTYFLKCKQITNKCLNYKTDSLKIFKVLNKFNFKKLDHQDYEQIRLLLNRDSKKHIDSGEIIVIKYYDSLLNYKTLHNKHIKHTQTVLKDSSLSLNDKRRKTHDYSEVEFKKKRSKWLKKQNKCIEKYEKEFPIKVNYLYKTEENVVDDYNGFNWIKDNGTFKNKFFKIVYNYNLVIIKPDGEYYLNGGHTSDKKIEKLLETPNWETFKNDLKLSTNKYVKSGYGLFKKIPSEHHSKHCF